ncbi:MAG: hypothetical protein ACHP9Y_06590, partial [Gammaproteobacteria bacterium]
LVFHLLIKDFDDNQQGLNTIELMEHYGKKILPQIGDYYASSEFSQSHIPIQLTEKTCTSLLLFPKLQHNLANLDLLVTFCEKNQNNLENQDVFDTETHQQYESTLIETFKKYHEAAYRKGWFCGIFNQTQIKADENLKLADVIAHSRKATFFGCKNRSRLVLEEIGIMKENGDLIPKELMGQLTTTKGVEFN